jgi:phosphatidylserine/phosphatidylglycerophosphate/cardiolipin synthase-like enzyme
VVRIVNSTELYAEIRELSKGSKRIWIASPYLGRNGHNIFDPSFQQAADTRFLTDVKSGFVDKAELKGMRLWAPGRSRTLRMLHAKLYIFDDSAVVSSANLSLSAFERNYEVGVIYTGMDAKQVRNAFSLLYKKGAEITPGHISALPRRRVSGGPGEKGTSAKHTEVEIWDETVPATASKHQDTNNDPDEPNAAPTFETDYEVAEAIRKRVDKAQKRLRLRRSQAVLWDAGVRAARKQYRVGSIFDTSLEIGSKKVTWNKKAQRAIGSVESVINVAGKGVIFYKTVAKYRVDAVLRRAAKDLRIYSGRPSSFQMVEYVRRVKARRKVVAR